MKRMLFESLPDGYMQVSIEEAGIRATVLSPESINVSSGNVLNIYKGVILRIEPSLDACFIDYGEERAGFLPFTEVATGYFRKGTDARTPTIKNALQVGQEIIVQVQHPASDTPEENRGAVLTTFITLPGRHLLLLPKENQRRHAQLPDLHQQALQKRLALPRDIPFTVRDSGFNCSAAEAKHDWAYLEQLWCAIEAAGNMAAKAPFLIYQDDSFVIRAIRENFQPDIEEIVADSNEIHEQLVQYMQHVMPAMAHRVKHANARQSSHFAVAEEVPVQPGKTLLARLRNLFGW